MRTQLDPHFQKLVNADLTNLIERGNMPRYCAMAVEVYLTRARSKKLKRQINSDRTILNNFGLKTKNRMYLERKFYYLSDLLDNTETGYFICKTIGDLALDLADMGINERDFFSDKSENIYLYNSFREPIESLLEINDGEIHICYGFDLTELHNIYTELKS